MENILNRYAILLIVCISGFLNFCNCLSNNGSLVIEDTKSQKILSRSKRYLVFPEGSSFSAATCFTIGIIGNPSDQFISWALNWGVAYELPTNQSYFVGLSPVIARRFRRDLYGKLELAMDDMGYNGKSCVLKALCQSHQYFNRQGSNMIEEILRTIFSLPKQKVFSFEHRDLNDYDLAHRQGRKKSNCEELYPNCGFSLLDLALGRYSKPPQDFNFM
ncbi:uncharacterized protein LOC129810177 [Phlebotomus papatasi]|uniref:Uncharacterized protein n=1 Tax=Phlebotomus papatasi TaxID=29031 RepID=A0A1B0D960_PHLPP|nr:uncharacterized protein LOC129810177 [Phlebotomus papatasi]